MYSSITRIEDLIMFLIISLYGTYKFLVFSKISHKIKYEGVLRAIKSTTVFNL